MISKPFPLVSIKLEIRRIIGFKMAPVAKGELSDAEQKLMDAILKGIFHYTS